jgi:uncharacterized membrane protein
VSYELKTQGAAAALDGGLPRTLGEKIHETVAAARPRLDTLDFLRGLVMIVMVLDHARDFLGVGALNPRDVHEPLLFLTRWITHYCAPVFVFLAGVSAFLYGNRGRTTGELSWFLFTRGLWLVVVEVTLVRFAWTFSLAPDFLLFQVIWVIGASMIVLAGLVFLPRLAVAAFALALIFGHNALDGIRAAQFGEAGWIWMFLHDPGMLQIGGAQAFALYSLIPWVGVMAAGFAFGPVFVMQPSGRRRWLLAAGITAILTFLVLRSTNLYGDPAPWTVQDSLLASVLSFINAEKYPPSLMYLTMTLGPALLLLALYQGPRTRLGGAVVTIGRVPFLFYVAHIFLLHALAVILSALFHGDARWLFQALPILSKPEGYGFGLGTVYLLWIAAVASLYPLCRWFAGVKQRRKDGWLSYL